MSRELPATVVELKQVRRNGEPAREIEQFQGVVVKANETKAHVIQTCGHHHRYEDMAMTCARRMRQRRGWWD